MRVAIRVTAFSPAFFCLEAISLGILSLPSELTLEPASQGSRPLGFFLASPFELFSGSCCRYAAGQLEAVSLRGLQSFRLSFPGLFDGCKLLHMSLL